MFGPRHSGQRGWLGGILSCVAEIRLAESVSVRLLQPTLFPLSVNKQPISLEGSHGWLGHSITNLRCSAPCEGREIAVWGQSTPTLSTHKSSFTLDWLINWRGRKWEQDEGSSSRLSLTSTCSLGQITEESNLWEVVSNVIKTETNGSHFIFLKAPSAGLIHRAHGV